MLRRTILSLWILFAFLSAPSWAQSNVTPEQARTVASRLLAANEAQSALEITHALMRRDSTDISALILHARALSRLGRLKEARKTAHRAWNLAKTKEEHYGAAMVVAQVLSADGKQSRAQFWLRRAGQVAPNAVLKDRAAQDYRHVKAKNPLSVQLSFGIAPSDNVNNAPRDNTIDILGLVFTDPGAVPIAGFSTSLGVKLRYAISESQKQQSYLIGDISHSEVTFTDGSVPAGIEEEDFRLQQLTFGIGRGFLSPNGRTRNTVELRAGRIFYGGAHLSDDVSLSFSQTHPLDKQRVFSWFTSASYSDRKDSAIRSGSAVTLGATWSTPLQNGARLSLNADTKRTDTDSAALTHWQTRAGATYSLAKPVLGADTQLSLLTSFKDYDTPYLSATPRQDRGVTLSSTFYFKDFDIYGFAPKLTFKAERNHSNVTRYDTEKLGVDIGIYSTF